MGGGNFGDVYKGILMPKLDDAGFNEVVAIKTIKLQQKLMLNDIQLVVEKNNLEKNLIEEAKRMARLNAAHVVSLKGFCLQEDPFLVIIEYMEHGDLESFLIKNKAIPVRMISRGYAEAPLPVAEAPKYNIRPFCQLALEIADGMAYLEHNKFIHRDLAARNCMISSDFTIKIGDFGLTRVLDNTNYYKAQSDFDKPVRWMAPESLLIQKFDSQSDVFSYGIVLWEIVTFGELPYPV